MNDSADYLIRQHESRLDNASDLTGYKIYDSLFKAKEQMSKPSRKWNYGSFNYGKNSKQQRGNA